MTKEILEILDNVRYWETCPDNYKETIEKFLTDNTQALQLQQAGVGRRLFLVTFLGKDEHGEIVKGIEVLADNSEEAMNLIKEVSMSREIYSVIES